jgi:hypothetical protein
LKVSLLLKQSCEVVVTNSGHEFLFFVLMLFRPVRSGALFLFDRTAFFDIREARGVGIPRRRNPASCAAPYPACAARP